mmetsp:Transcript_5625/g.16954  ORF Transcript_5625/g.16954 Transcript_5625/m.16954 type:complete len:379 (-) Transcript_5625:886-2022(-)
MNFKLENSWTYQDLDCKVLNRTAIILFGRLPVAGKVKTRLAKDVGDKRACECYREMCENVVRQAVKSTASVVFMCSEREEVPLVREWLEPFAEPSWKKIAVRAQCEGDLGERITHAFAQAFEDGCDEVIVAGTDVPDLSLDTFTLAFLHLQSFDVVIGPSEDDGYYLIGLHRNAMMRHHATGENLIHRLFKGIHWSTSLVYRDQVSIAYKLELSVSPYKCLPVLIDVDTVEDATRWLERYANAQNQQARAPYEPYKRGGGGKGRGRDSRCAAESAEAGLARIYDGLRAACDFTPPKPSERQHQRDRKSGRQGRGAGAEDDDSSLFEPYPAGMLSPTAILSAIKKLASPPARHDLPRKIDAARERSRVAKEDGKRLTYG